MNKAGLVDNVAERLNVTKKDARAFVEAVFDGIIEGLTEDRKVVLVGIGSFLLVNKDARTTRNPRTGEPVDVPAKVVPKFKPSSTLKEYFFNLFKEDEVVVGE